MAVQDDPIRDSHPNVVRRGPVFFAFGLVVIAGTFGAMIGYGLVRASCTESPAKLRLLLHAAIPEFRVPTTSCQAQFAGSTIIGALIAAAGTGVVAMLVLRAMTDWRKTPPQLDPASPRAFHESS